MDKFVRAQEFAPGIANTVCEAQLGSSPSLQKHMPLSQPATKPEPLSGCHSRQLFALKLVSEHTGQPSTTELFLLLVLANNPDRGHMDVQSGLTLLQRCDASMGAIQPTNLGTGSTNAHRSQDIRQ